MPAEGLCASQAGQLVGDEKEHDLCICESGILTQFLIKEFSFFRLL